MMISSGITTVQCNLNIARSLRGCRIQQGTCSEPVVATIASVVTGEM